MWHEIAVVTIAFVVAVGIVAALAAPAYPLIVDLFK